MCLVQVFHTETETHTVPTPLPWSHVGNLSKALQISPILCDNWGHLGDYSNRKLVKITAHSPAFPHYNWEQWSPPLSWALFQTPGGSFDAIGNSAHTHLPHIPLSLSCTPSLTWPIMLTLHAVPSGQLLTTASQLYATLLGSGLCRLPFRFALG